MSQNTATLIHIRFGGPIYSELLIISSCQQLALYNKLELVRTWVMILRVATVKSDRYLLTIQVEFFWLHHQDRGDSSLAFLYLSCGYSMPLE
jgi:hypothetical protein